MMYDTLVVNLIGGPGLLKSALAAHAFAELKYLGIEAELVLEPAKEHVWEGTLTKLENKVVLLGEQVKRIDRCHRQVQVIVTDGPIIDCAYYKPEHYSENYVNFVIEQFRRYRNLNFLVKRIEGGPYSSNGRTQINVEKAKIVDPKALEVLKRFDIPYEEIEASRKSIDFIVEKILEELETIKT
ncbi:MAG: hypothetical protein ACM3KR_07385 [Deltaproteobacteria bacterium]